MKPQPRSRPQVELLGDRALPSITLTGGVLEVVGSTGPDGIQVFVPAPGLVRVTVDSTGEDQTVSVLGPSFPDWVGKFPFPEPDFGPAVQQILIRSRGGDDWVAVAPDVSLPVEVRAWAGNDTVFGGGGNDLLLAGGGGDWVSGGSGDDTVIGQLGDDVLFGEFGNDSVYGDYATANSLGGNDTLDGGGGFDTLTGGAGNDGMSGGTEADSFVSGWGDDRVDGGDGFDQYFTQTAYDPEPTLLTSDVGLPVLTDDSWQAVDFDPYLDPATGWDGFGGYGDYWTQFDASDPFSPGFFDYSDYDYWARFDASDPFTPGFFENLFSDYPVVGDEYRPVRVIADDFVLTTGDTASSVQDYGDGYRIRIFPGMYQESSGDDYSDGYGSGSGGSEGGGSIGTVSITYDDDAPGKEDH